jgi:hypothetical protein
VPSTRIDTTRTSKLPLYILQVESGRVEDSADLDAGFISFFFEEVAGTSLGGVSIFEVESARANGARGARG